jgi:phospholipase/carboxylesterase
MADARQTDPERALEGLVPVLLKTLAMLELAQRHLHPPALPGIARELAPLADELAAATGPFGDVDWPAELHPFRDRLVEAATAASGAVSGLAALDRGDDAERDPGDFIAAIRALRRRVRALEALYPLAPTLAPLNRFFLERDLSEPAARVLASRLDRVAGTELAAHRGIGHFRNDHRERGGFSLYVPEWTEPGEPLPLIVALHGGSGHGRDFLWSWLREARTRGCLLLAPTSADQTWSMTGGEDTDAPRLLSFLEEIRREFPVDPQRMLLTGLSDGGSYSLLAGLRDDSPFTMLAPFSCMLSPEIVVDGRLANARDRRIHLVHGALDWMFPVTMARENAATLEGAGAELVYREIEDLSHTEAREEHAAVLDRLGAPRPG